MVRRLNIAYFPFRSRYRAWILAVIAIGMAIAVHAMTPTIKVVPAPGLQAWQMDGIVAALSDPSPNVQSIALGKIQEFEPSDLQKFPKQSNKIAAYAIAQLKGLDDAKMKPYSLGRRSYSQSAYALERLGKVDNSIAEILAERIRKSKNEYDSFKIGIAEILVKVGKADAETIQFLIDRAKDSRPDVTYGQDSAISALETLGKSDPKIVELLFDLFRNADMFKSRAAAAEVLINLNKQDESVIKFLLETIQKPQTGHKMDTFRAFSLGALSNLKKADSKTVNLLFDLLREDDHSHADGASYVLASLGKGDDAIVKRLSEMIINPQEDERIKAKALGILEKIRKADSRIFPVLKNRVRSNKDLSAAEQLVTFQEVDRDLITFLTDTIATPNPLAARDRIEATKILGEIQPLDFKQLGTFLQVTGDSALPDMEERQFLTYYYNRGHHDLTPLLKPRSN